MQASNLEVKSRTWLTTCIEKNIADFYFHPFVVPVRMEHADAGFFEGASFPVQPLHRQEFLFRREFDFRLSGLSVVHIVNLACLRIVSKLHFE